MTGMRTLRQCLLDYDPVMLGVIGERWGLELVAGRQHEAAVQLAGHMASLEAQAELVATLTPAEREALKVLLAAGGRLPVGAFTRRFGEIRPMGPGRLERERPWTQPQNVAESLWYSGLIYRAFDQGPGELQEVIYLPPELRAGLQAWIDAQANETMVLPTAQAVEQAESPGPGINDDVCTCLAYAYRYNLTPPPGAPSWPQRHAGLMTRLVHATPDYLEFLLHLMERAGLLKSEGQRLRLEAWRALDWLRATSFEQTRVLFETWRADVTWNELWRVPGLRCEDTGSWSNDPLAARETILDCVTLMQPDRWYNLEQVIAAVKVHRPDFQRPGGNYEGWYIRDEQTGDYLRGFASWDRVEGALLRYLLVGPLSWLGVVQVSEVGCRKLAMGAALLGQGDAPPERGDTRFEVGADGSVRVGNARRLERFQLSRVAEAEAGPGRTDLSWLYRFTPSSLARARRQHIGVERIIEFLQEHSGQSVPESLCKALQRWNERGSEVWAARGVVVRLARPELLEQLMSRPATRRLIREPISSTVAIVSQEHWPALRRALLEMGILVEGEGVG